MGGRTDDQAAWRLRRSADNRLSCASIDESCIRRHAGESQRSFKNAISIYGIRSGPFALYAEARGNNAEGQRRVADLVSVAMGTSRSNSSTPSSPTPPAPPASLTIPCCNSAITAPDGTPRCARACWRTVNQAPCRRSRASACRPINRREPTRRAVVPARHTPPSVWRACRARELSERELFCRQQLGRIQ